jgi:hypothetical protein
VNQLALFVAQILTEAIDPVRECREMRISSFANPNPATTAKKSAGDRNCHRKHVEDG